MPSKPTTEEEQLTQEQLDEGCCANCPSMEFTSLEGLSPADLEKGPAAWGMKLEDIRGTCHAGPKRGFQYDRSGEVVFVFPDVHGAEWCGQHPIRAASWRIDVDEAIEDMLDEEDKEEGDDR